MWSGSEGSVVAILVVDVVEKGGVWDVWVNVRFAGFGKRRGAVERGRGR